MVKLITVYRAKKEIERLSVFVELAESCVPETVEQFIVKEYAYLGSLGGVTKKLISMGITLDGRTFEEADVRSVINGKGNDELHKIVRSGYLYKTRPSRRKPKHVIF
jgi:hypothetical protein